MLVKVEISWPFALLGSPASAFLCDPALLFLSFCLAAGSGRGIALCHWIGAFLPSAAAQLMIPSFPGRGEFCQEEGGRGSATCTEGHRY